LQCRWDTYVSANRISKLRAVARAEASAEHQAAEAMRAARQGGAAAVLSARQAAAAVAAQMAAEAEAATAAAAAAALSALGPQSVLSEAEAQATVASAVATAQHAAEDSGSAVPETVDVGPVSVPVVAISSSISIIGAQAVNTPLITSVVSGSGESFESTIEPSNAEPTTLTAASVSATRGSDLASELEGTRCISAVDTTCNGAASEAPVDSAADCRESVYTI
jgi:hypothetical protein